MRRLMTLMIAVTAMVFTTAAQANDRAVVEAFYTQLLSATAAEDLAKRVDAVVVKDWVSIPTPRGGKGAEGLTKTLKFFGSKIPDLKWDVQEILQDKNRFIVRSIASGTPKGKFFGVEAKAGFKIMTIDIHEVKDGKIVQSYHVEDWARAIRQVSGKGH